MFPLMRYYLIASLVSIIAAVIALSAWVHMRTPETVMQFGETENTEIARMLVNIHGESMRSMLALAPSLSTGQLKAHPQSSQLDDAIKNAINGTPIIKIKIFSPEGRTLYSSDARQIGEDRSRNAGIATALAGTVNTELVSGGHFSVFEALADRGVISSYLPLRLGSAGRVDGVFEVYQDVTAFQQQVRSALQNAVAKLVVVLLALFGILFLIVRRADQVIKRQGRQSQADAAALNTAHKDLEKQVVELHKTDARRERFLALSKLSADWFWDMDSEFRFLDPGVQEDRYGGSISERQPGQTPWELANSELVHTTWEQHRADLAAHRPFRDLLMRRNLPAGSTIYVASSGAPVFAEDGSFAGYRGIASNVTARINAEEALAEARALLDKGIATKAHAIFLQELLDELPVGISLVDESLHFVASNLACAQLLDVPPDMLRPGAALEDLYRYNAERGDFGPGDPKAIVDLRMTQVGNKMTRNFERDRPNGKTLQVVSKALPDGSMLTVYADVSDRKKKESLLRESELATKLRSVFLQELLDALPVGVALIGTDLKLLAANAASARLQGLPVAMFCAGSSMRDVFRYHALHNSLGPGDVATQVAERVAQALDPKPVLMEREFVGGSMVEIRGVLMPNVGRVVTYTDISEHKRAERELVTAKEAAEAGSKAKSNFLAVMSHEIRTPMNAVIGLLELLRLSKLDAEQRDTVDTVRESGKSLLRLIDDVLDFSKIESGRLELHEEPTSLVQLFDTAHQNFGAAASQKGVLLLQKVDSRIAPALLLDPLRMRQIINNLLSNAIKFTQRGRVELSVELLGQDAQSEQVRISVRDTGVGIQAGALARVFEPFSQADATIERTYGGTGLGLAICQRLAELMGSTIDIDSQPGVGTRVGLTLKLRRAYVEASNAPRVPTVDIIAETLQGVCTPTVDAARAEGKLVLVVDDHPINRRMLARQLNALGYAALTAADGREALALWQDGGFGLMVTDCQMPVMDGYQLAAAIRKLEAGMKTRLPIIACTANVSREARQQCFSVGMDEVITKPVELATLKQLLDQWLPLAQVVKMDFPEAPLASDFGALEELVMGDNTLREELLEEFRRTNADDLKTAARAVDSVSIDDLRRAAHRIKGAARTVGSARLADAAGLLERAAQAGDWQRVADAWPSLRQECERLDARIARQNRN